MGWFTFTDASEEIFVVRLTDADHVAHARALIAGADESNPCIAGTVVNQTTAYNIGWSFHIEDIFFFEIAAEVGDSTMRYIEQHLGSVGGALLPGSLWTPWSSVMVGELAPIQGSAASETLTGSGSADIVFGKQGDDMLSGRQGDDHLLGASGDDKLSGNAGADKLAGSTGADTLNGGGGADILVGGVGADRIVAGLDDARDRVTYLAKGELQGDVLLQFDADLDRIDLRSIDADAGMAGNQRFRFVDAFGAAGDGQADGQLRVVDQGGDVRVELDFDGDSIADAWIVVRGVASLGPADFML